LIGADNLGELGKAAEQVGKEVAQKLLDDYRRGAVDRHASDMLLPYMALAGSGSVKVAELTDHVMNNIQAVERFLPVKFRTEGAHGQPGKISVTKA
jgi:RNA 3'-terminal phosphate cyclase (ATP)